MMNAIFIRRAVLTLLCLFCVSTAYSALTIDTNQFLKFTNTVTNIPTRPVVEPELPNTYLSSGQIQILPPEEPGRRYDVVFYVAVPVTFYLTLNILQLRNMYFFDGALLDNADWNYIFLNTLLIPLAVAFFDHQHVEREMRMREEMASVGRKDYFSLHLPVYSYRF